MKIYFKIALTIVLAIIEFGIILPFLISAADTMLVWVGIVLLILTLPVYYLIWKDDIE